MLSHKLCSPVQILLLDTDTVRQVDQCSIFEPDWVQRVVYVAPLAVTVRPSTTPAALGFAARNVKNATYAPVRGICAGYFVLE